MSDPGSVQPNPPGQPDEPEWGVRVTAEDLTTGERGEQTIYQDYMLVTAGDCHVTYTQVVRAKDGSETHNVTIKGVRRG